MQWRYCSTCDVTGRWDQESDSLDSDVSQFIRSVYWHWSATVLSVTKLTNQSHADDTRSPATHRHGTFTCSGQTVKPICSGHVWLLPGMDLTGVFDSTAGALHSVSGAVHGSRGGTWRWCQHSRISNGLTRASVPFLGVLSHSDAIMFCSDPAVMAGRVRLPDEARAAVTARRFKFARWFSGKYGKVPSPHLPCGFRRSAGDNRRNSMPFK